MKSLKLYILDVKILSISFPPHFFYYYDFETINEVNIIHI